MPNWTKEQQLAITKENTNIIVSAGAGSGKTEVLSERVIRKLQEGIEIDQLLILTFTNAAAADMKEKIRKKITKIPNLHHQLNKIDAAYITTFDSFALSVVKKYHYLLNLSNQISIVEPSIITMKKSEFLDEIMTESYERQDEMFLNLIGDFCVKDDTEIKEAVLAISSKMDMILKKKQYIDSFLDTFYQPKIINQHIEQYEALVLSKVSKIAETLSVLDDIADEDYVEKLHATLDELLLSSNYTEVKKNLVTKLPNLPKNCDEEVKKYKENISSLLKQLRQLCTDQNKEEMKQGTMATKNYVAALLTLILQLDEKINLYKSDNNWYEFHDIARFAIQILEENKDVQNEMKNHFKEIMVDEYQDTNDLQELFISYIENNNVYMVGDMKQSIYRFRNANPLLFQKKYEQYSHNVQGFKIDLNKNFRSRKEVLEDINRIFDHIMDETLGGANYKQSHQMIYGNTSYIENGNTSQDYHTEILSYQYEKGYEFSKEEIEAFIIAQDIQNRISRKEKVFDHNIQRTIAYQDIAILMDRTSKFDLYKKIFEYFHIPLSIYKDETITENMNLSLMKNILQLIRKVSRNEYDKDFEYAYVSVLRSYLFQESDETIFKAIATKNYNHTLLETIKHMVPKLNQWNLEEVIAAIIETFSFYEKMITTSQIANNINVLDYIMRLASNLSTMGYTIDSFYQYLEKVTKEKTDIRFSASQEEVNSVKIMTIHKSKGLEFQICYYSGLYAPFNIQDLKEHFIFDNEYGIITPYLLETFHTTIEKTLLKHRYLTEEISEKIRLFYVALTRAKEKIILVAPTTESNDPKQMVPLETRLTYTSFFDILTSIRSLFASSIKNIDLGSLNLTKQYQIQQRLPFQKEDSKNIRPLVVKEYQSNLQIQKEHHFSKTITNIPNKTTWENINYGTKVHQILETFDFLHPNFNHIDQAIQSTITSLLNTHLFDHVINIYQEYEFMIEEDGIESHGVIDLLLEYENDFKIVDYKLKHVTDKAYLKQLQGYQSYIEKITSKPVSTYLYSILDQQLISIS